MRQLFQNIDDYLFWPPEVLTYTGMTFLVLYVVSSAAILITL